jgi:hypothetical protein
LLLLLVPAGAGGCPRASKTAATTKTAAPAAVILPVDSGQPAPRSPAVPPALANAPAPLGAIVRGLHEALGPTPADGWQVLPDGPQRKERLAWLARDFRATAFLRADRLDEARLQADSPSGPLHVGLLAVHFAKCKPLVEATTRVRRAGRQNFVLPVLTVFRIRAQGHSLLFVLSESPLDERVATMFKNMDTIVGPDSACTD